MDIFSLHLSLPSCLPESNQRWPHPTDYNYSPPYPSEVRSLGSQGHGEAGEAGVRLLLPGCSTGIQMTTQCIE